MNILKLFLFSMIYLARKDDGKDEESYIQITIQAEKSQGKMRPRIYI